MSTTTKKPKLPKFGHLKVNDEVAMIFEDGCQRVGKVSGVWPQYAIFEVAYPYILGAKHIEIGSFSLKSGRYDRRGRHFTSGRVTSSDPAKVQAARDWCDGMLLRSDIAAVDWVGVPLDKIRRIQAILEEPPP